MKISTYKTTILLAILSLVISGVSVARAEDTSSSAQPVKRPTLKTQINKLNNDIKNNKDMRNARLEADKAMRSDIKDIRTEKRDDMRALRASTTEAVKINREEARDGMKMIKASTTEMFKKNADMRKEIAKKSKAKEFEIRKTALLHEFTISLNNLQNISTRIDSRITKAEAEGRVMTDAKALLATANDKLAKAKADVEAFKTLNVSAGANTSSSTEVDLTKPRVAGDAAIKSIKEARDAFQKVVTSISHAMGTGKTASTTNETH